MRTLLLACFVCALGACGNTDETPPDAGAPDSAIVEDGDLSPPEIPWLEDGLTVAAPALACPEGWREVDEAGALVGCEPFPEGGAHACEVGEAHFPGEPDCRPIGDGCPVGDYATDLPSTGPIVYVNASGATGGDGTMLSPHASLSEVNWSLLAPGTTVALAKGSYEGTLALKPGVDVVGACVAETTITGSPFPIPAVITVSNAGAAPVVRNLRIVDAPQRGVLVEGGRALRLEGVALDGVALAGITVSGRGSSVDAIDVVVRDTNAEGGVLGNGIDVTDDARLAASRVLVEDNRELGVHISGADTEVVLEDAVVRGTLARGDGMNGRGVLLEGGARVEASRLLVRHNREAGISADGDGTELILADAIVADTEPEERARRSGVGILMLAGSHLTAERLQLVRNRHIALFVVGDDLVEVRISDAVIRDTLSQESDDSGGRAVDVSGGAHFEASRTLLAGNREVAMFVSGVGTEMLLSDVAVRDTRPREADSTGGRGVNVQEGGRLVAARLLLQDNLDIGIFGRGPETELVLEDTAVRGTRANEAQAELGRGISVQDGVRIEATRLLVDDCQDVGIFGSGDATQMVLGDSIVRDTRARTSDDGSGRGISVQDGATLEASRLLISGSRELGLQVWGVGTECTLEDTVVRDTEARLSDLSYGYAVQVANRSRLTGERVLVTGARELGILAALDAEVDLTGATIENVSSSACDCPDRVFGHAVAAVTGRVRLNTFEIREADTCGLFVAPFGDAVGEPSLDVASGVVERAAIGACVQVDDYDLSRLMHDVQYRDNGLNLDTTTLTVPDALGAADPAGS